VRRSASIRVIALAVIFPLAACGRAAPAAQAPPSVEAVQGTPTSEAKATVLSDAASAVDDSSARLPTACADTSADLCTPPGPFVERLCARPHQEVALALFRKASPFTRLYLKARLDELAFDEEVLALRFHAQPKGGMIVGSGKGTYDVLRWDGSCSRGVEAEVFSRSRPPRPRAAHVQWHRVGGRMQGALIASSDAVKRAHSKRGKECKGAMSGDVSAACEKADAALVEAIVDHVRTSDDLPDPEGL